MRILAIDTSCDETSAAVTDGTKVLSNIIWSQASAHAKFGGVMPSLAQRMHEEHIDWVIKKALDNSRLTINNIDAVAVTVGPGLSIALGVGINKAKEISRKFKKQLLQINHVEAHLLSGLAQPNSENSKTNKKKFKFPAFGLCLSGGNSIFVLMNNIGNYKILAETHDDALGEALDKGARLLGLGYPGASVLERIAKDGDSNKFILPIPLIHDKIKDRFSYSGLKTAFVRLIDSIKNPTREQTSDLAASFQEVAFEHIIRVLDYQITNQSLTISSLMFGGGVANNFLIRQKLRALCKKHGLKLMVPYSKKLLGDNAAMIGVAAYLNPRPIFPTKIDRDPRAKISA